MKALSTQIFTKIFSKKENEDEFLKPVNSFSSLQIQ